MYYSENEKFILGINTIWILQPLLNTIINTYIFIMILEYNYFITFSIFRTLMLSIAQQG